MKKISPVFSEILKVCIEKLSFCRNFSSLIIIYHGLSLILDGCNGLVHLSIAVASLGTEK